ncbi:MAG TPA: helix-turn-helix transcriptional regulator [Candidatus Saccharimonadales bacterium]|nr:helix-turn-helix transcriptional regulator [Candidatus Saccharimonadales bacterium]
MNEHQQPTPFKTLGSHLKYLREQMNKSVVEVSEAVEINQSTLERIEAGLERPSEDILLLLISHFGMKDQEAVQLWEMAGYDGAAPDRIRPESSLPPNSKSVVMLLALDVRTIYTDGVQINLNQAGVTMNFSQSTSQDQSMPVARLGMSYPQAQQVLRTLEQALLKWQYSQGPKRLPPSSGNSETKT